MHYQRKLYAFLLVASLVYAAPVCSQTEKQFIVLPLKAETQRVLTPATLAVVVNKNDAESVALAGYYAGVRGVPSSNIIEVALPRANFVTSHLIKRELEKVSAWAKSRKLYAYALAFDRPYRVDANQSLTTVFAQGLADLEWKGSCNLTADNSDKALPPGAELSAKPAMLLSGGGGLQLSKELVQRGKAADASDPDGEILFLKTPDRSRSAPRELSMDQALASTVGEIFTKSATAGDVQENLTLMGLQTGIARLPGVDRLSFLPGAYADILTSYAGALNDNKGQTTASDFMKAGATASYGTVREPCNFPGKFPDPKRLLTRYLHGDSILEAYWKSIDMATEGLLVGDPLARPFPLLDARLIGGAVELRVNRHTLSYIQQNERKSLDSSTESLLEIATYNIGIFSVETGEPRPIVDVRVKRDAPIGELVGTIRDGEVDIERLMLGFLIR